MRRAALSLLVVLPLLAGCGEGEPGERRADTGRTTPTNGGTEGATPTESPSDEEQLWALAERVAAEQRAGDPVTVTDVTFFDDPEGCTTGDAALVTVEFEGDPPRGDILFCRAEGGGWELNQGILYGE